MFRNVTRQNDSRLATAGGIGAILLWSLTIAVARRLSEDVGAVSGAAAVHVVSGAISLVFLLTRPERRRQIRQLPAKYLVGCGSLFVGNILMMYLAIGCAANHEQVLEVGLVNYLWPALTLVLSLALLGEKANWILVPGTCLALSGLILVMTQDGTISWRSFWGNVASNGFPYAMALGAAVSWAFYSNLTRRWVANRRGGAVALFLPVTGVAFLVLAGFVEEPRHWTSRALAEALLLGLSTYAAFALWDSAMRRGRGATVVAASYLIPLLSTMISCLYLNILPGMKLFAACGILVLGSILSWISVYRGSRKATAGSPVTVSVCDVPDLERMEMPSADS